MPTVVIALLLTVAACGRPPDGGAGSDGPAGTERAKAGAPTAGVEARPAPDSLVPLPPATPTSPLEGTEWRLFALTGAGRLPAGAGATLVLDGDQSLLSGSTGCRTFQGAYQLVGGRLTLSLSDLGGGACPPGHAPLEAGYLAALRDVGSWRLRADTLDLLGEAGVLARFHP